MEAARIEDLRRALQRERRALVQAADANASELDATAAGPREELEEQAQRERDALALERPSEAEQTRLHDIDGALARMESGNYGTCENCGGEISEERLRAEPAARLCTDCARRAEEPDALLRAEGETTLPVSGRLPPDLDGLDDEELASYLSDLVREDGRIDAQELHISARAGVVYLEGALPSEPEHEMLRNIVTDVAGVGEIVDHLEIQRLAWERADRDKAGNAEDRPPGTYPDREPYGGTEDLNLTQEEGVNYDPPDNPPPPRRN
jgi:DnaK suppressor protein